MKDLKHIPKKVMDKELALLEQREVVTGWRENAEFRRKNRRWLRYSGFIALTVMKRLDEINMSQKTLAERMGCSPQYISRLLRGNENLTLETIAKLEDSLDLDLVSTALTVVDVYEAKEQSSPKVAEPD